MKPFLLLLPLLLVGFVQGEEAKPVALWIDLLQKPPVEASLQDLRLGCMFRVTTRPVLLPRLPADAAAKMAAYDAWVREKGNALADRWAAGNTLSDAEALYAGLLPATYYFRAWNPKGGGPRPGGNAPEDLRIRADIAAGQAAMRKGYSGAALSAADIEALSRYRVLAAMQLTEFKVLPFELGLTEKAPKGTLRGEAAPEVAVLPIEAFATAPDYSDALEQEETAFLTPRGVLTFLRMFESSLPAGVNAEARTGLEELRGKPVVLVLAYAPDVFWKVLAAPLQSLQHFYGDRAHILHVNVRYHDTYATGPVYAGEQAGDERVKLLHPETWEQMARMSRAVALMFPSVTYGLAVDGPSQQTRNAYRSEGGAGQFVVIDAHGKILHDPGKGWMYWTQGPYTDSVMWLNETEIALRHALGLPAAALPDTRARAVRTDRPSTRTAFAERVAKPYGNGAPHNTALWLMGKIEKQEGGVMTVIPSKLPEETLKGWRIHKNTPGLRLGPIARRNHAALQRWITDAEAGARYRFTITEEVELFVNGEEAEPGAFRVGDTVAVWYDLDQDPTKAITPFHVRTCRF